MHTRSDMNGESDATENAAIGSWSKKQMVLQNGGRCTVKGCGATLANGSMLHWHHHEETSHSTGDGRRVGVKRWISWNKYTKNIELNELYIAEIKKCTILCAQHHRETHETFRKLKNLQIAQQKRTEIENWVPAHVRARMETQNQPQLEYRKCVNALKKLL